RPDHGDRRRRPRPRGGPRHRRPRLAVLEHLGRLPAARRLSSFRDDHGDTVRIRVASPAEWRAWRELRLRALADSPDSFGETLEGARERDEAAWAAATAGDPTRVVLFAERDGEPVGMAVGRVSPDDAWIAHLYAMWVAPEARRL